MRGRSVRRAGMRILSCSFPTCSALLEQTKH
jgi:hypothetical protein